MNKALLFGVGLGAGTAAMLDLEAMGLDLEKAFITRQFLGGRGVGRKR